jgi:hypothetical protein
MPGVIPFGGPLPPGICPFGPPMPGVIPFGGPLPPGICPFGPPMAGVELAAAAALAAAGFEALVVPDGLSEGDVAEATAVGGDAAAEDEGISLSAQPVATRTPPSRQSHFDEKETPLHDMVGLHQMDAHLRELSQASTKRRRK